MASDKKKKSSGKMLASEDQIVIRQAPSAKTRYSGNLAPEGEIVVKQAENCRDKRY